MDNKHFISKILVETKIYFVIIFLFAVLSIFYGHYALGTAELVIFGAMCFYHVLSRKNTIKDISDYIENLEFHTDNASKDAMVNIPFPLTVLDLTGNIVWHNKVFGEIVGGNAFEKHISSVVPGVEILKILENRNDINMDIEFGGRNYRVTGNVVEFMSKQTKSYSLVLYWIDNTREVEYVNKYNDYRALNCIVLVDNYEDIVKGLPQQSISNVNSAIDSLINKWVSENEGILRKLEKDRYYILFENKNIRNIIEKKFDILDNVKKIEIENSMQPTLSIGIGDASTIQKSEEYAKASLDMALGRGGDQAVIKDDDMFRFFGGKSEGTEKSTRVKSRVVAHALRELIEHSSAVFVTGHKNSDADSFGASVAVCKMANLLGKKGFIVLNECQGVTKRLMDELKTEEIYKEAFISETAALQLNLSDALLVIVDTHNPQYVDAPKLMDEIRDKVLIDHHRRGPNYIDRPTLTYHEPYASSTCEMVTEVFQYIKDGAKLTSKEAQAVYSGIVLDTKNFSMKTGVRTFEAASFLRRMGVDTVNIKRIFQNDMSMYIKRAKIVSNAERYKDKIAISAWDENEENANVIASQAADELLNISDIKASFVICKNGDNVLVSGRSLGEYNVQVVLEKIGGGGHMTIAGAQFKDKKIPDVLNMLKRAIDETEE